MFLTILRIESPHTHQKGLYKMVFALFFSQKSLPMVPSRTTAHMNYILLVGLFKFALCNITL